MRVSVNANQWLWDVFCGHTLLFLAGTLFQLFLFSFLEKPEFFLCVLYGYAICGLAYLFLWEYRRHHLKHGNHWILRSGWWDLLPMMSPMVSGLAWYGGDLLQMGSQAILGAILLLLMVTVQVNGLLRMDRRLTDHFVAKIRRLPGADAAYRANSVHYSSWCLTFAWVLLAMLLYNGGGHYGIVSKNTYYLRLIFIGFSLVVLFAVEAKILTEHYWHLAVLNAGGNTRLTRCLKCLWNFIRVLPWMFWLGGLLLGSMVCSAILLQEQAWYVTVMLAFLHQLVICGFFHAAKSRPSRLWGWFVLHPVYLLVVSFLGMILLGTFLFELPFCYVPETALTTSATQTTTVEVVEEPILATENTLPEQEAVPMPLVDAFFTAASATCITGMTTVNVAQFPFWGRVVLCVLIQLGSLGIMTVSSFFAVLTGQRLGLVGNSLVNRVAGEDRGRLAKNTIRAVGFLTLTIELAGTAIFSVYLRNHQSLTQLEALGHGFFLSLNSFCNAGFEIYPGGFGTSGLHTPVPMITSALLILVGGLGFGVLTSLWRRIFHDRVHPQSPQVRMVLWGTAILVFSGTAILLFSEWNNVATLGKMSWGEKFMTAFFQVASGRSAGFEAIPPQQMNLPAQLALRVLMFIGVAPGSTGGGIRVTTIGVLVMLLWSIVQRRQEVTFGQATLSQGTVRQAIAVLFLGLLLACLGTLLLSFTVLGTDITLSQLSFEVVSAMTTVGMSLGITVRLGVFGKIVLIAIMFIGRVGFLTMLSAASGAISLPRVKYPKRRVMIG